MKHSRRRRRRPQASKQQQNCGRDDSGITKNNGEIEEEKVINSLVEVFSLASVEEAKTAFKEANGDPNKAAEILSSLADDSEYFTARSSSCSSSSTQTFGFDSSSSDNSLESSHLPEQVNSRSSRGNKGKRMVAATGTVSTVLGKDYVSSSSRKEHVKEKGFGGGKVNVEETEQFLFSMLGDDTELGLDVVKDVLCTCEFDVEKKRFTFMELRLGHVAAWQVATAL